MTPNDLQGRMNRIRGVNMWVKTKGYFSPLNLFRTYDCLKQKIILYCGAHNICRYNA